MPAETHSWSADRYGDRAGAVRRAVFDGIAELALAEHGAGFSDETRLVDIGLTDFLLIDLVEWVGREVGERSLAGLDGSELDECETVGDLISICAQALGERSSGSYSARMDSGS